MIYQTQDILPYTFKSLNKQPFSMMKHCWYSPYTTADVQGNAVGLWNLCSCDQPEEALAYLKELQEA